MNGICSFEKIHVKEVTSHFRNGWVFFMVYPRQTANITFHGPKLVNPTKIKPLALENVIVKAKKMNESPKAIRRGRIGKHKLEIDLKYIE